MALTEYLITPCDSPSITQVNILEAEDWQAAARMYAERRFPEVAESIQFNPFHTFTLDGWAIGRREFLVQETEILRLAGTGLEPEAPIILYECGICSRLHPWGWGGDCRAGDASYIDPADYITRTGATISKDDVELRSMAAHRVHLGEEGRLCQCDNCGYEELETDLAPAADLGERLDPGGIVPAGECSACGCLSYLV